MRAHDPRSSRAGRRGRRRPIVEGLEPRELPSAPGVSPSGGGTGSFVDPGVLRAVAAALYPPDVPPGTPTPREIRRQTFAARWVGQYTIGSPRFSDRASTIHLYGVSGGSNQFLKGKFQIALFPPADPSATPTPGNPYANQVTGVASLFAQSYLQSGSVVVLDLNGQSAPGSSPDALPTQLSWTFDANTSSGAYAAPGGVAAGSGFTQGAGTLQIQWKPDAHPRPGTQGSGRVVITFQGLVHASGITSAVATVIS